MSIISARSSGTNWTGTDTRKADWPSGLRRCVLPLVLDGLTNKCLQFDLFTKDIVLIPVNHNNMHWTAAAINFRKKRIESYDSMHMYGANVLTVNCLFL
jgi:hypothetical protein